MSIHIVYHVYMTDKKQTQLPILLDPDTRAMLEELAQADDRSMSAVIRRLIREAHAKRGKKAAR